MTPESVKCGDITARDMALYAAVGLFAAHLPDGLSCHGVCQLCVSRWPDEVVWYRGKFNGWDHSWLRLKNNDKLIIDVYPWCGLGPIMMVVYGYHLNPWQDLYVGEPQRNVSREEIRSN